jgi:hypothetical protein
MSDISSIQLTNTLKQQEKKSTVMAGTLECSFVLEKE